MVVPVAEELVDAIACYFGKDYRWQAISNTIDTDFFSYRQRLPKEGRAFRFCCLANFWPLKGYDVLIPAFQQLRQEGIHAELHIAGRGTDSAECRSMLSDGMTTHGLLNKEDVRALLYQCDALVLASRSEVQPLVLLEAMSTGIPVIATDCIPQSLRIEGGCAIVAVDEIGALAEAMKSVFYQTSFDGKAVSERVKLLASPEVIGNRLSALFSDILASR
jgi:glycosyltransferase involved in cell wall biosynthesis